MQKLHETERNQFLDGKQFDAGTIAMERASFPFHPDD